MDDKKGTEVNTQITKNKKFAVDRIVGIDKPGAGRGAPTNIAGIDKPGKAAINSNQNSGPIGLGGSGGMKAAEFFESDDRKLVGLKRSAPGELDAPEPTKLSNSDSPEIMFGERGDLNSNSKPEADLRAGLVRTKSTESDRLDDLLD